MVLNTVLHPDNSIVFYCIYYEMVLAMDMEYLLECNMIHDQFWYTKHNLSAYYIAFPYDIMNTHLALVPKIQYIKLTQLKLLF